MITVQLSSNEGQKGKSILIDVRVKKSGCLSSWLQKKVWPLDFDGYNGKYRALIKQTLVFSSTFAKIIFL